MRKLFLVVSILALAAASCGSSEGGAGDAGDVTISDAWSRQPAAGQMVSAAYGVVANSGSDDARVVSVTASVTDDAQLHETLMDENGAMSMSEVEEGFVVPAGGDFTFEPGGPHIMLMGIDPATYPTDAVEVVLTFEDGRTLAFDAEVRSIDGGMDHDGMDDDGMEMEDGMEEDG